MRDVITTGESLVALAIDPAAIDDFAGKSGYVDIIRKLQPASCIIVPLKARGRPMGALCIAMTSSGRNLQTTDVPIAEELGRRAALALDNAALYEAAIESSRLKDQFLASLSHELRTPLTSVYGWLSLLRDGNLPAERIAQALETMDRNVRAQITLIEELLDLSRIMSGTLLLQRQPFDPSSALQSCIMSLQPALDVKAIRLDVSNDLPPETLLQADPLRVQQMLWNLLSNAIKFTPPHGRIDIRAHITQHDLTIAITDNGIGIAPAFLPHVFDRFRQADSSTTRAHGGLGVGLSIVKHLAELHGGAVRAQSEGSGHGASFTLCLPLSPAA